MNTLFDAIKNNDIEAIWELIRQNPTQIDIVDIYGSNPLHYAAGKNMPEIIKILVEKGAGINSENSNFATPLFIAAASGAFDSTKILLQKGAEINCCNENYATPLFMAARAGDKKIAELLLRNDADAKIANVNGVTPYDIAVAKGHMEIANTIIKLSHLYENTSEDKVVYIKDYFINNDLKKA